MVALTAAHALAVAAALVLIGVVTVAVGDFLVAILISALVAGPIYLVGRNKA